MRIMENGIYRDMTDEEIAAMEAQEEPPAEPTTEDILNAMLGVKV